jgi:L-seryl-tRNA(Ser) seleniumtransferase
LRLHGKGVAIEIEQLSANGIEKAMRCHAPPIIGRIEEDLFILDTRTVQDDEIDTIVEAFSHLLKSL